MRNQNIWSRYGNIVLRRALVRTLAGLGTVALACVVLATDTARAEPAPQIALGFFGYGGPGCPAGTSNSTLSASGQFINFEFDAFTANASVVPPPPSCQLNQVITVAPGTRLVMRFIRGRGNAELPREGRGAVRGNFKLGNCSQVDFYHPISAPGPFGFLRPGTSCQTPCGLNTVLQGRIYVTAQNPPAPPMDAKVTLNRAGVQLELVKC